MIKITKVEPIDGVKIRQRVTSICGCGQEEIYLGATGDYSVGELYSDNFCTKCQIKKIFDEQYQRFVGKYIDKIEVGNDEVTIHCGDEIMSFSID
jgi:hypothetical protein